MNQRLARLREAMAQQGIDALIVSQAENRRYLSGFTGSAGTLLISAERALLATDFRYFEQAKRQAADFELVELGTEPVATLAAKVTELDAKHLGFEGHVVTVETYEQWKAAFPNVEWVRTSGIVEGLRQVKDAHELAAIEAAVRIADEGMAHIEAWLRPGVTEKEIAWELEVYMRTHGAAGLAFNTIVASGPNAALPHAVPTDRAVQVGDCVTIDMGALYDGYCSDLTRSFCLGRADERYRAAWDTVLQAQLAAEAAIRGGCAGDAIDGVARRIIYEAGYEGKFGHGLGHGVGLAIHENPRFSQTCKDAILAGAVMTVEPGVYDPAWGGVRIEDMVLVTEQGCRVLTQAPKRMVVGG